MRRFLLLFALIVLPWACRIYEPANAPMDRCQQRCTEQARRECSEDECRRGCEFVLDRIVERESRQVIACVANGARRCTDVVWADCASHVGAHADGGPPGPVHHPYDPDDEVQ